MGKKVCYNGYGAQAGGLPPFQKEFCSDTQRKEAEKERWEPRSGKIWTQPPMKLNL